MQEPLRFGAPERPSPDAARVAVFVPLGSWFFDGHFEGRPMLPGVAQVVAIAHAQAEALFGPLGPPRRLARVKFQAVVKPGDELVLELAREQAEETKIRFVLSLLRPGEAPEIASSGVLVYG
jgi:3-hydroxymyristoyl/3-hydroxydecanoyl-(acyl carrier protein) dehydratase